MLRNWVLACKPREALKRCALTQTPGRWGRETHENTSPQVVVLGLFNLESLIETVLFVIGLRRVVAIGRRRPVVVTALVVAAVVASVVLLRRRLLLLLLLPLPLIVLLLVVLLLTILLLLAILLLTIVILLRRRAAIVVIVTHACGGLCVFVATEAGGRVAGGCAWRRSIGARLVCAGPNSKARPRG